MFVPDAPLQLERLVLPPQALLIVLANSVISVSHRCSEGKVLMLKSAGARLVAAMPSMWLHVDAAWAGVSMACPEYRDLCLLNDINKYADSVCTNFHKACHSPLLHATSLP